VEGDERRTDTEDAMMGYGWGMGFGGWLVMGLVWLVPLVVVGLVLLLLPRGLPRVDSPEEILDRRYARGELDVDEYRRVRAELATRAR
jgi:putative membrane protein